MPFRIVDFLPTKKGFIPPSSGYYNILIKSPSVPTQNKLGSMGEKEISTNKSNWQKIGCLICVGALCVMNLATKFNFNENDFNQKIHDHDNKNRNNNHEEGHSNLREYDLISFYEGLNNATKFEEALNSSTPPTIYACTGNKEFHYLMRAILPEYRFDDGLSKRQNKGSAWFKDLQNVESSEYDVVMSEYVFGCGGNPSYTWILRKFKGQFILFSGESEGAPFDLELNPRYHGFGPIPETSKDIPLFYMQVVWWKTFKEPLPPSVLVSGELRPKGNEKHFLVYGQSNCVPIREEAFGRLATLGQVHQAGKCKGRNIKDPSNITKVNSGISINNWKNNQRFFADYRFCLVMEHGDAKHHQQYITEKIMTAFTAGCVPIYYGPDIIFDIFNEKAFVFYNISDPQPALDQIAELERDKLKYNAMMMEPIVAHGNETIEKYFSIADDIGKGSFKRRVRKKLHLPY